LVGMDLGMVAGMAQADMVLVGMALADILVLRVEDMVEDIEACMVEDMAQSMELGILVCKVLDKQACMEEDIRVCKAHIRARRVDSSHRRSDYYSLSKVVPKHLKKATRLIFLVVFSFIDSLC
jgi:hypothetical protein